MKHTLNWLLSVVAGSCLSLLALVFCECWAAEIEQTGGSIKGRLVWADNTPVTNCRVKLVDKIDLFTSPNFQGFSVQKIAISRDAQVRETDVVAEGRFCFPQLPEGSYYLFFRSPGIFEGDDWVYRYTRQANIYHLWGHKYKPDEYKVRNGNITNVPDFELVRSIMPDSPTSISNKPGVLEFRWPKPDSGMFCRLTIKHKYYNGSLKHPSYGFHEVKGNVYQIAYENPLYPGKHQFMVEILTPTLSVFAKSDWINFTVPGEVLFLRVNKEKSGSSSRTINWFGSDVTKFVKISSQDGSLSKIVSANLIKLPPTPKGRGWDFYALDDKGNELIPGWRVYFYQPETKSDEK
jgi:hypothetical protein